MSLSSSNGVVCKVEGTLSPPFNPVQQALLLPKLQMFETFPAQRRVFGSVLPLGPLPLCALAFRGSPAPRSTFPGSPFPGASSYRPVLGQSHLLSRPTGGDRPLTPFQIPQGRGSYRRALPQDLLSPARIPRTAWGEPHPQPLWRVCRLGRGNHGDRMRTGTGWGQGLGQSDSDKNKSKDTGRAETGQGRSGGPLLVPAAPTPRPQPRGRRSPAPATPGLGRRPVGPT